MAAKNGSNGVLVYGNRARYKRMLRAAARRPKLEQQFEAQSSLRPTVSAEQLEQAFETYTRYAREHPQRFRK